MRRMRSERGAVAVEFALVVPLLLTMVLGIVEFGIIYNAQIQVTAAAREGARAAALGGSEAEARARSAAIAGAPGLSPALSPANVAVSPRSCSPGANVTVTIVNYRINSITGIFSGGVGLGGTAVMRCGA